MRLLSPNDFHHLGVATNNLARAQASFSALGYSVEGPEFVDPLQGVRLVFMTGPGPRIELLEPAGEASPLAPWLKVGAPVGYHLAYEVTDLAAALGEFTTAGLRLVRQPMPAIAFQGRLVAFLSTRSHFLIELIERSSELS